LERPEVTNPCARTYSLGNLREFFPFVLSFSDCIDLLNRLAVPVNAACQTSEQAVYKGVRKCALMSFTPETRASLLIRVRDPADQAAWHEFVEIYRPLILRLARHKRMQPADADDVAQQILLLVAKGVETFDPHRARFRTWLHRVAQNAILNALTRAKPDRGSGDSQMLAVLHQHAAHDGPDSDLLRLEYRREVFRWAARQVRKEFQGDTWNAFWRTAVDGQDSDSVAKELGKSRGAIYAARSRVTRRIQEKVAEHEADR
jgi:RNA polymerase sigma factor (sigma-70 family)